MEKQMEILLSKINEKLKEQTATLTTAITRNVMEALDEKFKKTTTSKLELKEKRKNNVIFFGIEERGKTELELVNFVKEILVDSGIQILIVKK
ncbi:hypothetical protein SFRURICE_010429 [Spodoptera frugiperda]|uniref:SFRICE_032932 n=1 Tax=Spodoptera frugiperda TaxID=7108 RepID=A0A2H1WZZ9_SPOFR|nr:hypothetical protein SFRURICE_010429 [Spodoptera frugiperda]